MKLSLYAAPTTLPVTLDEVKAHLRIDDDQVTEDALLFGLIHAAVEYAETFTRRALITQTWDLKMDRFPCGPIVLPKAPLQSVSSITYTDSNGDSQTWGSSNYIVDTASKPGMVHTAYQVSWPVARDIVNAVTVRFVAGYGTTLASVPESIRLAMLLMIAHWYENREAFTASPMSYQKAPESAEALLWNHRVLEF
jgi:uncharacterized phiE125 gp8 family phage protein